MNDLEISLDSHVVGRTDVFCTSVGEELVIFDAKQGKYFGAGVVGQSIWNSISEKTTAGAVCDDLMARYDVDRETCERQVLGFLVELSERGLVEVS